MLLAGAVVVSSFLIPEIRYSPYYAHDSVSLFSMGDRGICDVVA